MKTLRWLFTAIAVVTLAGTALMAVHGGRVLAQTGTGPGPVVYASDRSGNFEVYVLDPETGLTTQLTNNPATDIEPAWSPDGELIVFVSDRDGDYELFVVRADGTDLRQLTNNQAEERQPRWQPGGEHIVYASDVNGQWDLYVVTADGAIVRQLTNDPADERGPGAPEAGPIATPGVTGPVVTATPTVPALPDATVNTGTLNLRENPGEGARILGKLPRDTALTLLARYPDNSWVRVRTPDGLTGWVYRPLLVVNINLANVPVENPPFIAPPPTATPTPAVTVAPQVIIEFWADRMTIPPGQCAVLSWRVENIREVYFQGQGVVGYGSAQVCPAATTTYNLRVIRVDGIEDNRYITIVVQ